MKVLLDESVPQAVRHWLPGHDVQTTGFRGWAGLTNGRLLRAAASEFDVFITCDKAIPDQQNLEQLRLAVVVLPTTRLAELTARAAEISSAVDAAAPGSITRLT